MTKCVWVGGGEKFPQPISSSRVKSEDDGRRSVTCSAMRTEMTCTFRDGHPLGASARHPRKKLFCRSCGNKCFS
ncbi:hypothetical protein CEXT_738341 [Caerostris extrusa]|uniref:Uncharacterized protein n=1 Tax=Caerostris extrusa TaxID=172846 RepID=A0AAV4VPG2_CAEEX|nr:hypothetical protein CEXT_738341 [Caerostris extrusa]